MQRKNVDLTVPGKLSDNPPVTRKINAAFRSPGEMMRDMGFEPDKHMTPLQFLVAVMNDDTDLLYRQEKKRTMMKAKGIGMNYRVAAATTAAKFLHMAMPQVQITSKADSAFADDLAKNVAKGNVRVRTKRVILETVEEISPDMPLPDAAYPPAFSQIEGKIIDETLDAEGSTEYDPDRDD